MRWLLTVPRNLDLEGLRAELALLGCTVDTEAPPVPLDGDEQVVQAVGSTDLPARLARAGIDNVKASPDSELELY